MALALNNFLAPNAGQREAWQSARSILISASEECAPLLHSVVQAQQKLRSEFSYHLSYSADRYFEIQTLSDILQRRSLFDDKYFIELKFKTKPSLEQQKQLIPLLSQLNEDVFLCLTCDKLDKKELGAAWVVAWQQSADAFFISGDESEIQLWSQWLFQQQGLTITAAALEVLLTLNLGNLSQLQQEINKLSLLFPLAHQISREDAVTHLVDNASYNIFALSSSYLQGDVALSRKIFRNICHSTEDAILVMWSLAEDLRRLIRIRGNLKANPSANFMSLINGLRIWGDNVSYFRRAHERISYTTLLASLEGLSRIDCVIKGIQSGDALLLLEQLILDLCRGD